MLHSLLWRTMEMSIVSVEAKNDSKFWYFNETLFGHSSNLFVSGCSTFVTVNISFPNWLERIFNRTKNLLNSVAINQYKSTVFGAFFGLSEVCVLIKNDWRNISKWKWNEFYRCTYFRSNLVFFISKWLVASVLWNISW